MDILKTLLILKNMLLYKKKTCFIKRTARNKSLLTVLTSTGLITFSLEVAQYKVIISPVFLRTPLNMKISIKRSKKQVWSNKKIIKEVKRSTTVFIFETSFGFSTQQGMLQKKIGGVLICSFSF